MPVRKRGVFKFQHALSLLEWLDLTIGAGSKPSVFANDDERREAWRIHRAKLLEQAHAGSRPLAWWDFEHPGERPRSGGEETLRLLELDEIGADELRVLKRWWRDYERTARAMSERPSGGRLAQEVYMERRQWSGIPDWYEPEDFREEETESMSSGFGVTRPTRQRGLRNDNSNSIE